MSTLKVLIVGGGIAGMSSAILLGRQDHSVDLVDLDPEWRVYGAGITVTSPTLRAFGQLGILEEFLEKGYSGNGIRVCSPDGEPLAEVSDPFPADANVPGSGGIMRPVLHSMLSSRVRASGATVRLGITVDSLDQDGEGVDVRFSDGSTGRYDLVIGADGVFSRIRSLLLPGAPSPDYTGQTIWRLFAPRPPAIDRRHFFLGGKVKIGVCPVSADGLYLFLLENTPRRPIIPDDELYLEMRRLMAGYGGIVGQLRDTLGPTSPIVVRPLEAFLLPPPWYVGRVLLIGDAAHPTTPQLASGAGLAVEDALVLAEELARAGGDVPAAFAAFMARRWERCRLVVENSIEVGRREQAGLPPEEQTEPVAQSLAKLAEPI